MDTVRGHLVLTALVAAGYVRDTMAMVIGDVDADARAAIAAAAADAPLLEHVGDVADVLEAAARLLANVWIAGQLTAPVHPLAWPTEALPRLCLQMAAGAQLSEDLRDVWGDAAE